MRDVYDVKNAENRDYLNKGDLSKLELLERVIKETMRLFPLTPIVARKLTNDFELGKTILVTIIIFWGVK